MGNVSSSDKKNIDIFSTVNLVASDLILKQTLDDMKNLKIVEATTEEGFKRNSFIYKFMSSMRQKSNDPLGQRAKKRKAISQR